MADAVEVDTAVDDSAYDLDDDAEKRKGERAAATAAAAAMQNTRPESSGARPDWVASFEQQKQKKASRLAGKCGTWKGDRGFGFIKRDDGGADVWVRKKSLRVVAGSRRALAVGEPVEFNVDTMPDGRLEAVSVTAPGGADLQGATLSDAEEEEAPAAAVAEAKPAEAQASRKRATSFVPRNVKRPAPTAKPKPKPSGPPPTRDAV
jgi:cold shock CspA family protein